MEDSTTLEVLRDASVDIAATLEQELEQATRQLSPSGISAWLTGAEAILNLGRGEQPVVQWLIAIPQVARECGEDVIRDILSEVMHLTSMTSGEVISRMLETLPGVARNLGDAKLLRSYLQFLHRMSATAARGIRPLLDNIDELLSKLTLSGLRRWADFGAQAYRRDYKNLVSYFALQSDDSQAVLLQQRRGTLLVKVQRKLNLYLRALWARDFFLRPSGSDHLDAQPYIEKGTMHLPDAVDDMPGVTGLQLYRATVAHMAAHVMYTTEALSAQELSPAQLYFIGLFEDARVEYCAAREFPGVKKLWLSLLRAAASNDVDAGDSTFSSGSDAAVNSSMALLRDTAVMLSDNGIRVVDAEIARVIDSWHAEITSRYHDNQLSWQRGIELFNVLAARRSVPSLRLLEKIGIAYRDDNRHIWQFAEYSFEDSINLMAGKQQLIREVGLMELINEVDNELAGDDAEEIWHCMDELHPYEDDLVSTPSFNEMYGKSPVSEPFNYSEWDYQIQLSRPDWVTVREHRQPSASPDIINHILQQNRSVSQRIRKIIDLLAPAGVQRIRRLEDGDEIDINAAIDAMVALRIGAQPSTRITMRNMLMERDLAVVVLLDLSESTNDPLPGDSRTILDLTREAVALVCSAIEGIGDSFAVHGFASDGRQDVQYYRFKDFSEKYNDQVKARLAGMQGGLSTRMGAALRHAGHHLHKQRERRKMILLVTDGAPADIDERDPQHLRHDTKKAVEELHTQGVYTYCLTLDANADSYVQRIFGSNHYTIIDHVDRLPEKLPALFASLTA